MQPRFITRYTTIAVFLCTCCLTFDVNARELELGSRPSPSNATKLTPEALQLLSDANALLEGFTPATVTPFELTPRRKVKKTIPVRIENSRVKVKFADELQIRLDVHNQLYSRTGRSSSTISDLVNALGVTLTPVHTASPASIDALIRRAELHSGKQQPDIAGTYWVEGDASAVNVAAELFYTLEEVEWVMYKPLLIRPTANEANGNLPYTAQVEPKKQNSQNIAKATLVVKEYGACWFSQNDCESDLEKYDCVDYGGTFLGNNSVCAEKNSPRANADYVSANDDQWCGTYLSPDDIERKQRMLNDGTWDSYRSGKNRNNVFGGSIVNMTVHIVRNSDGTGGLNEQTFKSVLDTHNFDAATSGLTWCIVGNFVYHDSDILVEFASEGNQIIDGFVNNTVNVYCVPTLDGGVQELRGFACLPPSTCFSMINDAFITNTGTFSHEMGHYFDLLHTFEFEDFGPECVDGSNCAIAGDLICDTPADPSGLTGGPEYNAGTCLYTGTILDFCLTGAPYDPLMNNFMSYFSGCLTKYTDEQINVFIAVSQNERANTVSIACNDIPIQTGGCCLADDTCVDTQTQTQCDNSGGIYRGADIECEDIQCAPSPTDEDAICCLYEPSGGFDPGCVDLNLVSCLNLNGIYMPAPAPEDGELICDDYQDCPEGIGPNPFPDECGEFADYPSYFAGDCYIDQTTCRQLNRAFGAALTPGCLDTPENIINDNYVVNTNAPNGPDQAFEDQECCVNIMASTPYCADNPWDSVCMSLAITSAEAGLNGCQRDIASNSATLCTAAFGIIQGSAKQPRIDTTSVGTKLAISYDLPTDVDIAFEIIEDGGRYLNIYFDGVQEQMYLTTQVISSAGTWIESIAATHGVSLTAKCCAWTGCCQGDAPPDGFCESQLLDLCNQDATWLTPQPLTALEDDSNIYATFTGRGGSQCISFAGSSSVSHVLPSPATGPDFAKNGMLAWMSPAMVPNTTPDFTQTKSIPFSSTPMTGEQILQCQQLLPWPMGGFSGSTACGTQESPPILSPEGTINFAGEGLNLFPDSGNPGGFGQSDIYKGAYGYGQKWADDDGAEINGAFGNNVKIAVLDWSAHLQAPTNDVGIDMGGIHEELTNVILEGVDTGNEPLDLIFDENLIGPVWYPFSADHGTAVLGVIAAKWGPNSAPGVDLETRLANNVGMLGMVPDAETYFFPLASEQEATGRQETAWLNALALLGPGDIICAAYRPIASNAEWPNLNYLDDINGYLELANSLGVCTIIAAGDRGFDLGIVEPNGGDQGAIVATSVSPGLPYKRWCDGTQASNFTTVTDYAIVTASSWGMGVTTCGKGPNRDNLLGYSTCIYPDPTNAHDVHRYAYTNNFEHTGAAAAVVAGATAILQGFTKQRFQIALSATVARQLIGGGRYEGVDKEGNALMPFRDYDTEDNSSECEQPEPRPLDWDLCAPETIGWRTGSLINPLEAMRNAVYNPIFDTPHIDSIIIVRGTYLLGNLYSVAADDSNLFGVSGIYTSANQTYPVPSGVPGGYVRYPSSGNVSDIYITGELETTLPANNRLTVALNFEETQPDQFYLRCEMWDFRRRSWEQASGTTIVVRGSEDVDLLIENASRFISRATTQYHLRLTAAVTNLGEPQPPYPIMYDQILVRTGLTQVPNP